MRFIIIIFFTALSFSANAQNWNEWFRQKKTQRKYLLEQIAALKVYLDYTKEGYEITRKGLSAIQDIKSSDLHIHTDYFESLLKVNPTVRNYVKVVGIISYQVKITRQAKEAMVGIKKAAAFSQDEIDYCVKIFGRLLAETMENLNELTVLITDGKLGMRDDERLKRIDALYSDMQDKYGFYCAFREEMAQLYEHRLREKHDVRRSKALNNFQ